MYGYQLRKNAIRNKARQRKMSMMDKLSVGKCT